MADWTVVRIRARPEVVVQTCFSMVRVGWRRPLVWEVCVFRSQHSNLRQSQTPTERGGCASQRSSSKRGSLKLVADSVLKCGKFGRRSEFLTESHYTELSKGRRHGEACLLHIFHLSISRGLF